MIAAARCALITAMVIISGCDVAACVPMQPRACTVLRDKPERDYHPGALSIIVSDCDIIKYPRISQFLSNTIINASFDHWHEHIWWNNDICCSFFGQHTDTARNSIFFVWKYRQATAKRLTAYRYCPFTVVTQNWDWINSSAGKSVDKSADARCGRPSDIMNADVDKERNPHRVARNVAFKGSLDGEPWTIFGSEDVTADAIGVDCGVGGLLGNSKRPSGVSTLLYTAQPRNNPKADGRNGEYSSSNVQTKRIVSDSPIGFFMFLFGGTLGAIFLIFIGVIPTETKGQQRKREKYYATKKKIAPHPPKTD